MSTAMISLVLAVLVLPLATAATVTTARRNCSTCGDLDIPYPFGLDPSCSLPGFSLTCAVDTDNSSSLLLGKGNSSMEVLEINSYHQFLYTSLWYSVKMIPGVRDYSVHWETPGRPFAISGSSNNSLFVVGCGVNASLFIGNSADEVGNCYVLCADAQVMEKLPVGTCNGIGCCFIDIEVNLRAFTLNISRISDSATSNKVYAFIDGDKDQTFRPIDALRPISPEEFNYSNAALEWAIPYQPNCKRAMEDRDSYACVANQSKCQDSDIGGYFCYCPREEGHTYLDNPYVDGGCPEYKAGPALADYGASVQPRTDCPTSCGNVSVPFPFGTELSQHCQGPCFRSLN